MQPTLESIIAAHKRLSPHLLRTPLLYSDFYSDSLSEASGKPTRVSTPVWFSYTGQVFLKLESEQLTGSFKARGAYNKVLLYSEARKAFTTASSGNHAAGVVSALKKFGAQVIT
jgi:threonine dehydratase